MGGSYVRRRRTEEQVCVVASAAALQRAYAEVHRTHKRNGLAAPAASYAYDPLGRLTSAQTNGSAQTNCPVGPQGLCAMKLEPGTCCPTPVIR